MSGCLAYERSGSGSPLLLLHGFTGSAREWADLAPRLATRRDVIAVDLIGHGLSPAPDDPAQYTLAGCVVALLALLDRLDLPRADVLGYSMGGRVALHLAAAAPGRVNSLILESASPGIEDAGERAARAASDDALADRIEREGLEWFVDHWAALPLFASQAALPPAPRAALRSRRLQGSARGYANSLRGMGAGRQKSLWERLPALTLPVLVVCGALDTKYLAISRRLAGLLPAAQLAVVADAGHTVHLEQPERFAQLVVRFLDEGAV